MNIWYSVIIHERSNDSPSLRIWAVQGSIAKTKFIDEYGKCLKLRIKNKMRKGNHLYEIEFREVDKEKKRIKIHYKGFSEDTD